MGNKCLKFTGERFVPDIDNSQLKIEHFQRYRWASQLVKDKVVLDAACGEGYGSNILAQSAKDVLGLDIDQETVEWAKNKYRDRRNLKFMQGSIAKLPIEDSSIDVVVSFETIEHVDAEIQRCYLQEIKRILKPEGFLVMSTPNKSIYSDKYMYHNEFHVKEFYHDEYLDFICSQFCNVKLYHQFFEVASFIEDSAVRDEQNQFINYCDKLEGKYYIAIASNGELPNAGGVVCLNNNTEYASKIDRILALQDEVEERNNHLHKLDAEINQLRLNIEKINEIIRAKEEENDEKNRIISCQEKIILEKDSLIQEKETIIRNKNGHIEQLLQVERDFENVKNSKFGRIMYAWWGLKEKLIPQGSKRRFFAKLLKKFLRHPIYMLKKCTPARIKRTLHYMRTENVESIENRLEAATLHAGEPVERAVLDLISLNESICNVDDVEKLILPKSEKPLVSIIIPVYNQIHYTYNCLKSIIQNTEGVSYEVIIGDDCSTDLTKEIEQFVENIIVSKTKENVRFLRNCNQAAQLAKGKYILFLNNDTQVQKEWLSSLVDLIESDEQIGMVGSKLLYPDGTLQEAGGIIWGNGNAWNYGNGQSPNNPEYNYVKEVDYISGASIMIRTDLWNAIGGFDELFAPAYCEDSDLAFEIRRRGYKVMYQPRSVVVHFEGKSNGTDLSSGVKKYQIENSAKLRKKWASEYKRQSATEDDVFYARERSQGKQTILVIDHYVPQFDKDAGSKTTWQYLKMFVKQGYNVKFMGDNFYQDDEYTPLLEQMGIEVLYGPWYARNYKKWIIENQHNIDFVYLNRPHITEKYIDFIKQETNIKIIYYGHDLHFLRIKREYELYHDEKLLKESQEWYEKEIAIMRKADMNYYPSNVEVDEIHKMDSAIPAKAITAYVYEQFRENISLDFSNREGIVFVGGFGHPPNEDAVLWFANEIYPIIREKQNIPFYIVGSKVTEKVKKLHGNGIIVKGFVTEEELMQLYDTCKIVVVPLRYGAGVKGKVVEALYYGTPMVSTTTGIEGIQGAEYFMEVTDDAREFADKVMSLYNDNDRLRATVEQYQKYVKAHYSTDAVWDIIKEDFSREEKR